MITLEKTCPPYSALTIDTGFTTRAIGETNSIPAKKTLSGHQLSPWAVSCWLFLCIRRVNQYLWTWIRAREITHCAWHCRLGIALSSWVFQSGRVISGGYVRMGPIHVPCILKSLRKHEPYSHVPHTQPMVGSINRWSRIVLALGAAYQPNFRVLWEALVLFGPQDELEWSAYRCVCSVVLSFL